jgi:ferric-dicitrate binding protein FerR (iron transport regulator)
MLRKLLEKLMFGKITPEDYKDLKDTVLHSSDKEIDAELNVIWDGFGDYSPMDADVKAEVRTNINRQMGYEVRKLNRRPLRIVAAAAILLPLLFSIATYLYFSSKANKVEERIIHDFTVFTDKGQKTRVLLPDGTYVWLNSQTRLTYSSDFCDNERKVHLVGEAFFEVRKNDEMLFTVEADGFNVVVHGTEFNVSAYPENETIDVTLLNGKVVIESGRQSPLGIEPGQMATMRRNTQMWSVSNCDAQLAKLWTQNKLKFEDASISEVISKLEHWYGINITVRNIPTKVSRYGFTLKSESVREMLEIVNKLTPIKYEVKGEEVQITYK